MKDEKEIRVVIVEDNADDLKRLTVLLGATEHSFILCGTYDNAQEAIIGIDEHNPDLVFLDVDLKKNTSGFEVLEFRGNNQYKVIFTTAHIDYAVPALRLNAIDFLHKPINKVEFENSLVAFFKELEMLDEVVRIKMYKDLLFKIKSQHYDQDSFVFFKVFVANNKSPLRQFRIGDVKYIESDESMSKVFLLDEQKEVMVSSLLKEIEKKLKPFPFMIRTHKQYMVNSFYIREAQFNADGNLLLLKNCKATNHRSSVPVSRTRKDNVREKLNLY